jgi:hypothetical protein
MAIDTVVEEVAANLEEVAEATRRINTNSVGFFLGGVAVGFGLGFYWGYKFNKEAIKAEAFKQSEAEVAKIRESYQQRTIAAQPKPSVEELIEEKGYERPLPPPVPVHEPPVSSFVRDLDSEEWDFVVELKSRLGQEAYVIHQNEFHENGPKYKQVTYTYYQGDHVLTDEDESRLSIDNVIGSSNNLQFGHGTDDEDVVFIRNDKLKLDMEVCRTPKSWEEEVLGIENPVNADDDDED